MQCIPLLRQVDDTVIIAYRNGTVSMRQGFSARVFCPFHYREFPSEIQRCAYNLTSLTQFAHVHAGKHVSTPDFEPPDEFVALFWQFEPFAGAPGSAIASLRFELVRDVYIYLYPVIIPSIIISVRREPRALNAVSRMQIPNACIPTFVLH